jgi:hypothetical protein
MRRPQNLRTLLKRQDRLEAWCGQHQDCAISIFGSWETATNAETTVAWLQV